MLTKGMIMLVGGVIGFLVTLIWILIDILNKDKKKALWIEMATKNVAAASGGRITGSRDATDNNLGKIVSIIDNTESMHIPLEKSTERMPPDSIGITEVLDDETEALPGE